MISSSKKPASWQKVEENEILNTNNLHGLILAGGQSRRMGRDKAMIAYHGMPHYLYLAGLMEGLGVSPYLSARADQIEKWKPTIPCIADQFEDKGPLGGILSAHLAQPEVAWLVVACDYAYLGERSLRQLLVSRSFDHDLTSFISPFDQGPEPLLAIWEQTGFHGLEHSIQNNSLAARLYLKGKSIKLIQPEWPLQLKNVNQNKDI
jgi:molybdopterin-guanine dinucleotide biosynthesis protein A